MARRVIRADTFKQKTRDAMKELGTYNEAFEDMIGIYADLRSQYEQHMSEACMDDLTERTPLAISLEKLRADIKGYADALGLSPRSYKLLKEKQEKEQSALDKALSNFKIV